MLRSLARFNVLIVTSAVALIFFSSNVFAAIGVGVGTGKIEIDETIKSGGIYTLPDITVYNTGDVTAVYAMHLTLNETQDQHKPDPAWFSFEPASFELEPGKARLVTPTLRPPLSAQSGEYFGYLEAYPDSSVDQGGASVGVAAATKLTFNLESTGTLDSIYNRAKSLFMLYAPWSYAAVAMIILLVIVLFIRKFVRLNVQIVKVDKKTKDSEEE